MNNYEILNLPNNSSIEDVKKRYYKLAKEYHPDKTKNDSVKAEKFLTIKNAYEQLLKGISDNKKSTYQTHNYDNDLNNAFNKKYTSKPSSYLLNSIKNIGSNYYFHLTLDRVKCVEVLDNKGEFLGKFTFNGDYNGNIVLDKTYIRKNHINLKIIAMDNRVLYKTYKIKNSSSFINKIIEKIKSYIVLIFYV